MVKFHKIIALVGATGSGKTELSIEIARNFKAHIVHLDSVQMYKELNIGSGKPTAEQLTEIPHHLINTATIVEPKNSFQVFQESKSIIETLIPHTNVIITGGTGLYYKNLLWGMFCNPTEDKLYRKLLDNQSTEELYTELLSQDAPSASLLHPHDRMRIIRALEVLKTSGQSILSLQNEAMYTPPAPFLFVGISYPRPLLYERIHRRIEGMINQGLLLEMSHILESYKDPPPILKKIIGYKELFPYLEGKITLEEAIADIKKNTRRYAKRQLTLFRHLPDVQWFIPPELPDLLHYIHQNG